MNYFGEFLKIFILGGFLLYMALIVIDGIVGLKDFFREGRRWRKGF